MKKGTFDDIRLFILKKNKQYIDCLNLFLDSETNIQTLDEKIFSFINMTLTRLQIKKKMTEYNSFKKELKKNLIKIAQKSLENTYTLINFWFSKDKIDCVRALKEMPKLQLDYIEYTIKKIIDKKEKNLDFNEKEEDFMKFILEKHVFLLCKLNRKNEVISWLKKLNEYPIKECIDICKKNQVYDCLIFLYKKEGNTTEALKICHEIIKNTFNEILKNIRDECNKELYNKKKIELIKFIEDTIDAIESEDKENTKANKDNNHELWSDVWHLFPSDG
jgi:hypothetical protein